MKTDMTTEATGLYIVKGTCSIRYRVAYGAMRFRQHHLVRIPTGSCLRGH